MTRASARRLPSKKLGQNRRAAGGDIMASVAKNARRRLRRRKKGKREPTLARGGRKGKRAESPQIKTVG